MNPQFQNMSMGRGMPMQMNPAFAMNPQMGGQAGGQMGGQQMQAQGMPQQNVGHPQIQKHIYTTLQSQGPFSGWQATVNVNERAAQVKLLVDSLRLVRPPVELPRALEVALQFERKCFQQSMSKEQYYHDCNEKLGKIRDQRAQQLNPTAGNMQGMPGMQAGNQNFQMHVGQNMGNMGQQSMGQDMGQPMNIPNMQQMQPPMAQQRAMNMQQGIMNMQLPFQAHQMGQENNQKPNEAEKLSVEENKIINLRAAELAKNTPKDKIRANIEQMNPAVRAQLAAKNIDPIIYYFRMMATKEFRQKKANGMNQIPANISQLPDQQVQDSTMNQNQTPYMNEMGRYQGQQAEGLRSQEQGQMVVPASNNTNAIPDSIRITQQMLANSQRMGQQTPNVNPGYLEQQRRLQQQQQQQANKMQQAAQFQAQSQENARAQAASMAQNQMQNSSQTNTPLSAINRPVNLSMQGVSPQPGSRPPSRTPMMNQPGQMQPMNMQDAQNRERILASYPVPVQNILRQKPISEWKATIHALSGNAAMQRSASQQPQGMQRQPSAQIQNGAFLGGANIGTPMQQSLSAGAMAGPNDMKQPGMPQTQGQINPDMIRQRQAAMQQQQQRMQAEQGKQGQQGQQVRPLNQQQMNFMDSQPVPPQIFMNIRQHAQVPPEIKTWLNFKQWAMNNPNPNIPMPRLMQFQASHFAFMMKTRQQAAQQAQQQAQSNMEQQHQAMNQGQIPQSTFPNIPQPHIPTDQDIQRLRAQNSRLQSMTDDQVRQLFMNRQQLQLQQAMQAQSAQRVNMQQNSMPPVQQQPKPQPQPQPQVQPQPQPQRSQPQTPVRPPSQVGAQSSQAPPNDKGVKRPNELSKPEGPTAPVPMAPPGLRQLTREQFNSLTPEAKNKYMKAQHVQRLMGIGKLVASTAPKWPLIQLNPAARQKVVAKLTEKATKNMLTRFDQLLFAFWEIRQDEAEIKGLILNKLHMLAQYDPMSIQNKSWVPLQNLSMTFERAEEILKDLGARFQQMTAGLSRQQQSAASAQPAQLTPENLRQLQEQEDRKKSTKGGKDVPPAPTASQPPFQIGDRGHGAPKYAGSALKQEDLKLPADPKRRKKNPAAGNTPASQGSAPTSATSPQVTKPQIPPPTFRCPIPSCERNRQSFSNQAELDQHTNSVHKIDTEPVIDPLAFLDASLREAFNLDENFKQIRKPLQPKALAMEKTASKSSIANLKTESKPSTPTPMMKIPSQSGRPQSSVHNKDDKGLKAQSDDWEHTNTTWEELNNIFGDMDWEETVPAAARDLQDRFLKQYEQSEEWQKLVRKPADAFTETTTDKSTSPPEPANKEPINKTEAGKKDDLIVDLEIDGLDLTGLEEVDNVSESAPNGDTAMGDSPFEILDKPALTAEQQFLLNHGIDYSRPDSLTDEQKKLMAFITEPQIFSDHVHDDTPWEEIDWDSEEKQREEHVQLGTPGAWNGHGFNGFP